MKGFSRTFGLQEPAAGRARLGQQTWGIVRLLRPVNVVLFVAGVALGGVLVAGGEAFRGSRLPRLLLAAASAACVGGAANSINDLFDLAVDRINRPERPLPARQVTPRAAWWTWAIGSAVGVLLSSWLSAGHVALAGGAVGALYFYSARLKHTPLLGNLLVALVTALALVYGGWAVGPVGPALVGAAFAFLTTLAREIIKDVQDVRGDRGAAARTLPVVWGQGAALRLAAGVLVITMALTPGPYLWLGYGGLYLLLVLGADGALLRALWLMQASAPDERAERASRLVKGAMALGMVALAGARLA